jgi:hypothetical protein
MDIHAIIHAMEEELLTLLIINAFVQVEIGMVFLVLFVQEVKYGALQLNLAFVQLEIGTELLVLHAQQIKSGIQLT